MRRPFRERNPVPIGVAGLAALALALVATLNAGRLPLIGTGDTFHAHLSEASGLAERDQVRIAGVEVGRVERIDLEGAHVDVRFSVDSGVELGKGTRASVRVGTVLGQKYLSLDPRGRETLAGGSTIPLSRTQAAFDLTEAFSGLTTRVEDIDVKKLEKAFDTLSATFEGSAPQVRSALRGLRRLSQTVASRDAKLQQLLARAENVSSVLAERDRAFATLLKDGNKLLREVRRRRAVIHQLLVNTVQLSDQLSALVKENQQQLGPALDELNRVVKVLRKHQRDLSRSLNLLSPFVQEFTDTLGTGRWFDAYVQNFVPLPAGAELPAGGGGQ